MAELASGAVPDAPGAPGLGPTWTSSAKDLVGTSLGPARLWYTLGYGILNEVYYPRADLPPTRDPGFLVADGKGFWIEVKRLANYEVRLPAPGVPAPTIVHSHDRFVLTLRIAPEPVRDVLLIELVLEGDDGLVPYVLLAPHLGGSGRDNRAACVEHYGRRALTAEQGPFGLAVAAVDVSQRDALRRSSAGYVGTSDGWQDFAAHGAMTWRYERAGPGNVALLGEVERRCVVALGLGSSAGAAASLAVASLMQPFEDAWQRHVGAWTAWHARCDTGTGACAVPAALTAQLATSRMVLRCHQDKTYAGAMVASLSVPWGNTRDERGGYHLVWPRDLVECAQALLGVGGEIEAREVLKYLIATQHADGHWNQNQWLGGTPFWHGVQLDEAAFPVLLATLLAERGALDGIRPEDMVSRALSFIAGVGPVTDQDRWEEDRGVNTFTLATAIAALVSGATFLGNEDREMALALADDWNARIESWTVMSGSALAERFAVAGYYLRVAPSEALLDEEARHRMLPIKNRAQECSLPADEQIATDFLQLVRFGLRRPDAPLIRDTLAIVDALLRVETPAGPAWHRYNGDGYGEHEDGSAFDGTGIGRAWPLLTGERGHYEIAAGRSALPYLEAMAAMCGGSGMLPEQVWDAAAIPERGLQPGRPTGSAMPLAWAHAEFVKLCVSMQLGAVYDCPRAVRERYAGERKAPQVSLWLEHAPVGEFFSGSELWLCLREPAQVTWRVGGDQHRYEVTGRRAGLGLCTARLATRHVAGGQKLSIEIRFPAGRRLETELVARTFTAQ
jgi:glucoamylase